MHYSIFTLAREALTGNRGWTPAWRNAQPRAAYDISGEGGGPGGIVDPPRPGVAAGMA